MLPAAGFRFFCTFEFRVMGRFSKLRKNKKYSYRPRYYDDKGEGNPFKIQHKLDKYRTTAQGPGGLKTRWNNAISDIKQQGDRNLRLRFWIILAVLLLIVLYIFDFDLSIFFPSE
ncbi:riboflavin synthase subunit beta [Robiginitalea biformata HTCC2501]|uniref:Riboflavin synthase subunit beta n=2 Tax=Robiginitalea TaxID=252306 RepID=A4CQ08_ROBBH|nr:riboflavin synthase subunit beta [Robiginitalea biformata HTCC2501]